MIGGHNETKGQAGLRGNGVEGEMIGGDIQSRNGVFRGESDPYLAAGSRYYAIDAARALSLDSCMIGFEGMGMRVVAE